MTIWVISPLFFYRKSLPKGTKCMVKIELNTKNIMIKINMKPYWTKMADIPEYNISQIWLMWCKNGRCYEFQQWSFWLMWPGKVSQTLVLVQTGNGAVRQEAITWANVYLDQCRYMSSLGHNEWRSVYTLNVLQNIHNILPVRARYGIFLVHSPTHFWSLYYCFVCNITSYCQGRF